MNSATFLQGVVLAFALAAGAAAFWITGATLLDPASALRLLIAGLGCAYLAYLCTTARRRAGRVTSLLVWVTVTAAAVPLAPSAAVFALLQVALLWLLRVFLQRRCPLSALADLALNAGAVVFAGAALTRTGSVFLTVWSFFLVQALHVVIPRSPSPEHRMRRIHSETDFAAASRRAEAAIEQLAARNTHY
jgi:hypothetical protein